MSFIYNSTLKLGSGKDGGTKSDEFSEKFQGGVVIFNPKICVADIENFTQDFLSMKLIQKSNFRVQVCFLNNCIEKNQNKTHFEEDFSSHTSLRDGPGYQNG